MIIVIQFVLPIFCIVLWFTSIISSFFVRNLNDIDDCISKNPSNVTFVYLCQSNLHYPIIVGAYMLVIMILQTLIFTIITITAMFKKPCYKIYSKRNTNNF